MSPNFNFVSQFLNSLLHLDLSQKKNNNTLSEGGWVRFFAGVEGGERANSGKCVRLIVGGGGGGGRDVAPGDKNLQILDL